MIFIGDVVKLLIYAEQLYCLDIFAFALKNFINYHLNQSHRDLVNL